MNMPGLLSQTDSQLGLAVLTDRVLTDRVPTKRSR